MNGLFWGFTPSRRVGETKGKKAQGKKRGEDDYFSRAICLWSRVAGRLAQISLIENGASSSRLNKEANSLKSESFLMMYRPVETKSRYNAFSILSVSFIGVTHTPKTRTNRYHRRISGKLCSSAQPRRATGGKFCMQNSGVFCA